MFSTLRGVQCIGGYHKYIRGGGGEGEYHEYIGDVQYIGGIP